MPASGEIYQVTYQMTSSGQTIENVLHFRELDGLSTPAQIAVSAEKYLTEIAALIVNQVAFTNMIIKQMTPVAYDETITPPVTTTSGSASNSPANNTIALIFTKRTGTAGKSHRGRIYLGGLNPSIMGNNSLNSTGVTLASSVATALMGVFGPSGSDTHLQLGLYSKKIGGDKPFTVAGWMPVTKLDVQAVFGNQRRRRLGVGI